jgi:hypothetical protein
MNGTPLRLKAVMSFCKEEARNRTSAAAHRHQRDLNLEAHQSSGSTSAPP